MQRSNNQYQMGYNRNGEPIMGGNYNRKNPTYDEHRDLFQQKNDQSQQLQLQQSQYQSSSNSSAALSLRNKLGKSSQKKHK